MAFVASYLYNQHQQVDLTSSASFGLHASLLRLPTSFRRLIQRVRWYYAPALKHQTLSLFNGMACAERRETTVPDTRQAAVRCKIYTSLLGAWIFMRLCFHL